MSLQSSPGRATLSIRICVFIVWPVVSSLERVKYCSEVLLMLFLFGAINYGVVKINYSIIPYVFGEHIVYIHDKGQSIFSHPKMKDYTFKGAIFVQKAGLGILPSLTRI